VEVEKHRFHGFYPARVRKSLTLKILVSAAGFWAHFNIVTYLLTYLLTKSYRFSEPQ